MNLEIKKLSVERLDDWLDFFDNTAFTDDDEWAGCYCMCYHWNKTLDSKKSWDCSKDDASYNRKYAIDFIKKGKMQGYLAYEKGKVVGWCNANDKKAYNNVNFCLPYGDVDMSKKVKAVVCFNIAPAARGNGVASQLLDRVCSDAVNDGYDFVEAYPFRHDANHAYHGPQSMYEKAGFDNCGSYNGCVIFRKKLK